MPGGFTISTVQSPSSTHSDIDVTELKRGMKGVYQHCSEKHLHRYLAEFDFRYNNRSALGVEDVARSKRAVVGAKGKRLTYRQPD